MIFNECWIITLHQLVDNDVLKDALYVLTGFENEQSTADESIPISVKFSEIGWKWNKRNLH